MTTNTAARIEGRIMRHVRDLVQWRAEGFWSSRRANDWTLAVKRTAKMADVPVAEIIAEVQDLADLMEEGR